MPFDPTTDPQDTANSSTVTDTASAATPAASTPVVQPPVAQPQAATVQQAQPSPAAPATVSNQHPSVYRAGVLRSIAETLAGGPQYQTTIDPTTGTTVRTPVPVSGKNLALAIALEAIGGSLTGLSQTGPNHVARAAVAGYQQGQAQVQQRQAVQDAQAQADAKQKSDALIRQAQSFELASRVALNTSQAERYGVDSLKDAVSANVQLVNDYDEQNAILERNVTQDQLMSGMQDGTYSPTREIAIPDGFTNVNGKYEQTFAIVNDPRAKLPLTTAQAQAYGDAGVQGFAAFAGGKNKVPDGMTVPGTMIARANQQLQAVNLMKQEFSSVADGLSKSDNKANQELAKSIPSIQSVLSDPAKGPALQNALEKFQRYVSHSDVHGMNFYQSLQQMAAPSKPSAQNPKTFVPNPDAPLANVIAGAIGNGDAQRGWDILKRFSEEVTPTPIKNEAEAASILANNDPSSKAYKVAQKWVTANTKQKTDVARAEAQAREDAKPPAPTPASLTQPDALGFTPTVTEAKEANKRFGAFKKNLDALSQTEQSYKQFQEGLAAINAGNWNGADSVVSLFNAIGLSAAPLAGRGFRVNQNVIAEHQHARGWMGELQARLAGAQTGAIITPAQLLDYSRIAQQARQNQYISTVNALHNAGISGDAALPTGNGQHIDPDTVRIFLALTGGNKDAARKAAIAKGWSF